MSTRKPISVESQIIIAIAVVIPVIITLVGIWFIVDLEATHGVICK